MATKTRTLSVKERAALMIEESADVSEEELQAAVDASNGMLVVLGELARGIRCSPPFPFVVLLVYHGSLMQRPNTFLLAQTCTSCGAARATLWCQRSRPFGPKLPRRTREWRSTRLRLSSSPRVSSSC